MKKILFLILIVGISSGMYSCKKKSYPCPGLGQMSEADLSQFDENGNLKGAKGKKKKGPNRRINHESGLVEKKSPKQIRAPRKTRL